MKKMRMVLVVLAVALPLSVAAAVFTGPPSPAADFTLKDTGNQQVALSEYRGKNAVLLFFWTTWCPYCRNELKELQKRYPALAADGIVVLAVNTGETPGRVDSYIKDKNLPFRVLLDRDGDVASSYRVQGVPTFILLNKEGSVVLDEHSFPYEGYKKSFVK
ncbi:MAG TPA: TlpA disulfide reductase family protein [Patescibacteria group bacterium]|nr:TlpA disulfide reductase family protein [Patescibacteria group bacterium]